MLLKPVTFTSAPLLTLSVPVPLLPMMSWVCVKSEPVTLNVPTFIFSVPAAPAASPSVAATPLKRRKAPTAGEAGMADAQQGVLAGRLADDDAAVCFRLRRADDGVRRRTNAKLC